jgi:orotidine-5'-phosphate decarboxylase
MAMTFREKLVAAQTETGSWLCVGLDPDPARMPPHLAEQGADGIALFGRSIVEATAAHACAFKPNLAFFLAHGSAGIRALELTLDAIPPGTPVLLDAKIGDIGNTQRQYARAAFEAFDADAVTVSPYVGADAVAPLLEAYPGRGIYVLARTSNPGAPRFQDHPGEGAMLYQAVADAAAEWAEEYPASTVGLVVGATYEGELKSLRQRVPSLPFLIPGIGAQGGALDAAARFGPTADGVGPLISASRAILYASTGEEYTNAAEQAARQLKDSITRHRSVSE